MTAQEFRSQRHTLGHSQSSLAKAMGMTKRTILRWEGGYIPIPIIAEILINLLPERSK